MPQLKSGRHVGLVADTLVNYVKFGTDTDVYAFIVA